MAVERLALAARDILNRCATCHAAYSDNIRDVWRAHLGRFVKQKPQMES